VRLARALAALCALAAAAPTGAVGAEGPGREKLLAAAREIVLKARYCALVTLGRDGQPQARIVDPLAPEPDLSVWIATSPLTRKVDEIRANPRVTLFYFDPSGPAYVTLHATAELVSDAQEKAKHWKEDWAPFYKDGPRGDDFVLIRARPTRLEIVSQGHGIENDPVSWRPTTIDLVQ
jgi:general stress protein 26